MNDPHTPEVAITGAHGWLGRCVRRHFQEHGWKTRALVRQPSPEVKPGTEEERFQLGEETPVQTLLGAQALVHCAYDFTPDTWPEIERVNVRGSERLFRAAAAAGVPRLVFISTMSAFAGTQSLYGRAKLAIEAGAARHHALVLRPGLITGEQAGGMYGGLVAQVRSARRLQ